MKKQLLLFLVLFLAMVSNTMALPLTNVVPLTPSLTFYLESKWGIGPTNQFKSDEMICKTLSTGGSNIVTFRYMPSYAQFYDFKLFDDQGREVAKTKKGLEYSQPVKPPTGELDLYRRFIFHPTKGDDIRDMFRPDEMFVIINKGVYQLELRMRICVPLTNGVPDTNAMARFLRNTPAESFGIVESSPVRVEVIKK